MKPKELLERLERLEERVARLEGPVVVPEHIKQQIMNIMRSSPRTTTEGPDDQFLNIPNCPNCLAYVPTLTGHVCSTVMYTLASEKKAIKKSMGWRRG